MDARHLPSPLTVAPATAPDWLVAGAGRIAYALVALPLAVAGVALAPFGQTPRIGRAHRAAARRLLGSPVTGPPIPDRERLTLRLSAASLPAGLLSFLVAAPLTSVFLARGVFYPFVGAGNLQESWGGPTLPGAWAAHLMVATLMMVAVSAVLVPVAAHQARLAQRYLGPRPRD